MLPLSACAHRLRRRSAGAKKVATVHWLRHRYFRGWKFRPKEHVKEDAGHASMATTDRYIDVEMRERHASARHKNSSRAVTQALGLNPIAAIIAAFEPPKPAYHEVRY